MSKEKVGDVDPDDPPPLTGSGISSWSSWTHFPSTPEINSEPEVTAESDRPAGEKRTSQEQRKLSNPNEKPKPPEKVDIQYQRPEESSKARRSTMEETQGPLPASAFSRELCLQGGACAKAITLGEPEKEQLQSVGRHLLKIGRQLLEEMDFVEGLLGKFGSLGFEGAKKVQENPPDCEATTCGLQPTAKDNSEAVKEQLLDAIAVQAKRLTWLEHETAEYQHATKAAKFGTPFATPVDSNCIGKTGSNHGFDSENSSESKKVQDMLNQEMKKRLTVVEAKVEKMSDALDTCEKQICSMSQKIQDGMCKMAEDSAAISEQVQEDFAKSEQARESIASQVSHLEAQLMNLAQIVWNLKCETRAQMHFGTLI